jgi:hypothetical protein
LLSHGVEVAMTIRLVSLITLVSIFLGAGPAGAYRLSESKRKAMAKAHREARISRVEEAKAAARRVLNDDYPKKPPPGLKGRQVHYWNLKQSARRQADRAALKNLP